MAILVLLEVAFTLSPTTAQPSSPVTVKVTSVLSPFATVTVDGLEVIAVATSHDTGVAVAVDVAVGVAVAVGVIVCVTVGVTVGVGVAVAVGVGVGVGVEVIEAERLPSSFETKTSLPPL